MQPITVQVAKRTNRRISGWWKWASILVGFLVLILTATGWYLSEVLLHIGVATPEDIWREEVKTGLFDPAAWNNWPKEDIQIRSQGNQLFGVFVPAPTPTVRTVILVHGVSRTYISSVKYATIFRRLGWNVLVYDQPRHGVSQGQYTTYGWDERLALRDWVKWLVSRTGPETVYGLHGESLGASTVLMYLGMQNRAAFAVVDCPYADFNDLLCYRLKMQFGLPSFPLLDIASLWTKVRAGFYPSWCSPRQLIGNIHTPILFIHGESDSYIPPQSTEQLFQLKPNPKQLYLCPGAKHAKSLQQDPVRYATIIEKFLVTIPISKP